MKNAMQPTGDQIKGFQSRTTGAPIFMLNLLKFRDRAKYEDGRETSLSGKEAYALYSAGMQKIIPALGGSFVFGGEVRGMLIGEVADMWDAAAIVQYPDTAAMMGMMADPAYQEIHPHREAGLEGQLLIECAKGFSLGSAA
ncbi:DUF1330 domain-containing protein [Parvularcula sp. IMCC14364]|uniref:DUF1330 domain-containing protein n=1 Tax=Parvularcula sp. IMCC14364 TaxID=3067902 RepID=UPI0027416D06|nr:DUF1330 domain-containing protein [Parvularcula sp. IMCC14364]